MKPIFCLLLIALAAPVARAQIADFAPANLSSVIFSGRIAAATGGANGNGAFASLLASDGNDYTLAPDGALSDPVPFAYVKTGGTTARLTEAATRSLPAVEVALTFSGAAAGTFVATYSNAATQSGTFTLGAVAFAAPLVNVSTRTVLAAGGNAITGFVIGGTASRRVLIRAIGPGLVAFGVAGTLANPVLSLWRGATVIGGNDDFSTGNAVDRTLPFEFERVGAFALTATFRDAALIATLAPGAYTALIAGGTATDAGVVLLEVYFLD